MSPNSSDRSVNPATSEKHNSQSNGDSNGQLSSDEGPGSPTIGVSTPSSTGATEGDEDQKEERSPREAAVRPARHNGATDDGDLRGTGGGVAEVNCNEGSRNGDAGDSTLTLETEPEKVDVEESEDSGEKVEDKKGKLDETKEKEGKKEDKPDETEGEKES